MNIKKLLLSVGTLTAVAAPIATVVSCGGTSSTQYSEDDLLKMSNLKSSEAHSKLQDLWLSKVLGNLYGIKDKTPLEILKNLSATGSTDTTHSAFETDFKNTLTWVLKNKLFSSKDALSSIYQSLKSNAPDEVINSTPTSGIEKHAVQALNKKVFDRTNIHKAVTDVLKGTEWKDIFYNYTTDANGVTFNPSILGVKDLILKMMVTKKYLGITSNDFKAALPEENAKLASKYKDSSLVASTAKNFPLVVSVMNSRLAYETSIELDASKSRGFIVANEDNLLAQDKISNIFDASNSLFSTKFTYSTKAATMVTDILAKTPSVAGSTPDETVGFKGISALPSGDDNLDTGSASSIKLANSPDSRDGFVVDDKLVSVATDPAKQEDIRFTDKDKTKVELNYYTSLMPTYDTTDKTLEWDTTKVNLDLLMNEAYTKDSTLYSTAIKYFTEKTNPIKIEVTNDWARDYYLDEGLKYIADEDE